MVLEILVRKVGSEKKTFLNFSAVIVITPSFAFLFKSVLSGIHLQHEDIFLRACHLLLRAPVSFYMTCFSNETSNCLIFIAAYIYISCLGLRISLQYLTQNCNIHLYSFIQYINSIL